MKPTDREQKFTLLSWSTAVRTGLLGGFVGFWAAFFLPFFFATPSGDIHFYLGLFFLMIGALLGIVCGAAVGLRIVRIFRGPNRH